MINKTIITAIICSALISGCTGADRTIDLSSPEATLSGYIDSLRQGNVDGVHARYHGMENFSLRQPAQIQKYEVVKKITFGKKEVTDWNKKRIVPPAEIGDIELHVKEWEDGKETMYSYWFRQFNGSWKLIAHSAWGVD